MPENRLPLFGPDGSQIYFLIVEAGLVPEVLASTLSQAEAPQAKVAPDFAPGGAIKKSSFASDSAQPGKPWIRCVVPFAPVLASLIQLKFFFTLLNFSNSPSVSGSPRSIDRCIQNRARARLLLFLYSSPRLNAPTMSPARADLRYQ